MTRLEEKNIAYDIWFALVHSAPEPGREDKWAEAIHAQGRRVSQLVFRLN